MYSIRLLKEENELLEAFKLRYRIANKKYKYLVKNLTQEILTDEYDSEAYIFGLYYNDKLIGTHRGIAYSKENEFESFKYMNESQRQEVREFINHRIFITGEIDKLYLDEFHRGKNLSLYMFYKAGKFLYEEWDEFYIYACINANQINIYKKFGVIPILKNGIYFDDKMNYKYYPIFLKASPGYKKLRFIYSNKLTRYLVHGNINLEL